jgi:YHS domain-containing protein
MVSTILDVVCGMEIDQKNSKWETEHKDKVIE